MKSSRCDGRSHATRSTTHGTESHTQATESPTQATESHTHVTESHTQVTENSVTFQRHQKTMREITLTQRDGARVMRSYIGSMRAPPAKLQGRPLLRRRRQGCCALSEQRESQEDAKTRSRERSSLSMLEYRLISKPSRLRVFLFLISLACLARATIMLENHEREAQGSAAWQASDGLARRVDRTGGARRIDPPCHRENRDGEFIQEMLADPTFKAELRESVRRVTERAADELRTLVYCAGSLDRIRSMMAFKVPLYP